MRKAKGGWAMVGAVTALASVCIGFLHGPICWRCLSGHDVVPGFFYTLVYPAGLEKPVFYCWECQHCHRGWLPGTPWEDQPELFPPGI
jgi:hypothetical protein